MLDATFGTDKEVLGIEVDVLYVQIDEFLQPDAGPEKQLDNDAVTSGYHTPGFSVLGSRAAAKLLEQSSLLGLGQELWQRTGEPVQSQ